MGSELGWLPTILNRSESTCAGNATHLFDLSSLLVTWKLNVWMVWFTSLSIFSHYSVQKGGTSTVSGLQLMRNMYRFRIPFISDICQLGNLRIFKKERSAENALHITALTQAVQAAVNDIQQTFFYQAFGPVFGGRNDILGILSRV